MSCANRTTDNKHFHCPPRMDDGRHFTDYRSNCHFNNLVRANNAVMNSHDYRMFLTNNAMSWILTEAMPAKKTAWRSPREK